MGTAGCAGAGCSTAAPSADVWAPRPTAGTRAAAGCRVRRDGAPFCSTSSRAVDDEPRRSHCRHRATHRPNTARAVQLCHAVAAAAGKCIKSRSQVPWLASWDRGKSSCAAHRARASRAHGPGLRAGGIIEASGGSPAVRCPSWWAPGRERARLQVVVVLLPLVVAGQLPGALARCGVVPELATRVLPAGRAQRSRAITSCLHSSQCTAKCGPPTRCAGPHTHSDGTFFHASSTGTSHCVSPVTTLK